MSDLCVFCNKPATQTCSACNQVFYCGKDHQKQDWKNHKTSCVPYKIQTNDILGRHVVATRNIKSGETVMKSLPLILGPKTVSSPLCLTCHKKLDLEIARYDCTKCGWPLCNEECEKSPLHKKECEIFEKACYRPNIKNDNSKQSVYSSITPLRALLLKMKEPEKFKVLLNCQSHLEKHLQTPVYQILRRNLVPFFTDILKIDTNETEILNICSIFDTNCFEVRDSQGLINVRGVYPSIALLSHDCKHNTKHTFHGSDFNLILTTTIPIKKGELITTTYTQTLWGTSTRRAHLKMSKNFDCFCERCKDPSEFGTYIGSVNCNQCGDGSKVVSLNPVDKGADWRCEKCGYSISAEEMDYGNEILKNEISYFDKKNPIDFENFLKKYEGILHKNNSYVLQVKYALCQMYGNINGFKFQELPNKLIKRKIELCQDLLDVAEILEPGHSRFRGSLLFELFEALEAEAKLHKKNVDSQAKKYLKEAEEILRIEPDLSEIIKKKIASVL